MVYKERDRKVRPVSGKERFRFTEGLLTKEYKEKRRDRQKSPVWRGIRFIEGPV